MENRTPLVVIQHPRERQHAFNTVRLAELCLRRLSVVVDYDSRLRRDPALLSLPPGTGLLYPHPTARDITTLSEAERPKQLVVIDGTWHQARTLYRDVPILQSLPHFTLPQGRASEFSIRRQPEAHCLSSIEAIAIALDALEPETPGIGAMLDAFRSMVRMQVAIPHEARRRRSARRPLPARSLPRALVEGFERLVVVYVETVPTPSGQREIVSCVARRLSGGERFYAVLRSEHARPAHLEHMNLTPGEVRAGLTSAEFIQAWGGFVREHDTIAMWNSRSLAFLRDAFVRDGGAAPPDGVALKAAYAALGRCSGSLDDIVRSEGLCSSRQSGVRCFGRVHNAALVAELMHRLATG